MVKVLLNVLMSIYDKLKYTLMSFLLKLECHVLKYICIYTFVMMNLEFSKFKMLTLIVILNNASEWGFLRVVML